MLALIFSVVTGQSHKEQLGARSDVCEMESCLTASVHWPGLKALLQRQEIMLSLIPLFLCDAASVASLDLHRNQSLLNGAIHKNLPVVFSGWTIEGNPDLWRKVHFVSSGEESKLPPKSWKQEKTEEVTYLFTRPSHWYDLYWYSWYIVQPQLRVKQKIF